MPDVIYQERVKTPLIVSVIYLLIAAVLFLMAFTPQFFGIKEASLALKIVIAVVIAINLVMFFSFFSLAIVLTRDYLLVGFGVFKKKINKGQIREVSAEDFNFKEWRGYGIRLNKNKEIGYISGGERLIKLSMDPKNHFITSNNAEQLKNLIQENLL